MTIEERADKYALEDDDGWCVKDLIKEQAYIKGATDQQEIDKKELKSKWISIKEKLPEELKNVLLYDYTCNYYSIGFYQNGKWHCLESSWRMDDFTHWTNLPEFSNNS